MSGPTTDPVRDLRHLGDFTTTPRMFAIAALALPIGAIAAVAAWCLLQEAAFRWLPMHWTWWPAIGGLVIGVGGRVEPQALGVGHNVIEAELTGDISLDLVMGILVVKTLIWSLSLGSGTSGGVLAPVFMIGGALGALEAHVFPAVGPGLWALVALAGVFSGVMRSPITGVVLALELTHRWDALLPVMIGSLTAYGASALLLKRSALTEKIARRGYHLSREYDVDPLEIVFVGDVMTTNVLEFARDLQVSWALAALENPRTTMLLGVSSSTRWLWMECSPAWSRGVQFSAM